MESSPLVPPEDVLESLMNDGTIDSIRLKIINQLKANEELKSTTIKMAEQSKVLNTPGAEKQTKRELFDSLRQELEAAVLEKASKSVWELILDENGLGKEISEEVEKVFCRLSGQEPPLYYPYPESQTQEQNEKQRSVENKGKEKLKEKPIEKEVLESATKKKKYVEVNAEGGGKLNEKENEKETSESVKKMRKYVEASSESGRGDEGGSRSNVKPGLMYDSGKSHLPLN